MQTFDFADFHIDFNECSVRQGDKSFNLTRRELELLKYFVVHAGRLIPRTELLEKFGLAWTCANACARSIHVTIAKKFEPDPANPRHFLTIRDLGYKFVAVTESNGESNG